ncbi:YqgE/AlgH family protein [Vibrio gallicus]|uniref:YqgE/AlgH family protein n=1 Tax=Vibrio gallicus TaxID=190897 RepID=UPI0021C2A26F|nr:YqgE/AlgH family protein [Vibrio gallicus]
MNLTNHFLVAMPSMQDSLFERSVVYICEHNENGAMGIIINAPIDITVKSMLEKVEVCSDLPLTQDSLNQPVHNGGPVAEDRGFILHHPKDKYQSSIDMTETITMTTSKDILQVLGTTQEPEKYLVALGYAGWEAGQLESELADNSWLTTKADPEIIFTTPVQERWNSAVQSLGIDIAQLSTQIGHA